MSLGLSSQPASPSKPPAIKARYTRNYLASQGISAKDFHSMTLKIGIEIKPEELDQDVILSDKTAQIQKKLGFQVVEDRGGQDGMFGPKTYEGLKVYIKYRAKRSGIIDESSKARGVVSKPVLDPDVPMAKTPPKVEKVPHITSQPEVVEDRPGETPSQNILDVMNPYEGVKIITRLPGNGNRKVAIYIPQGFDPNSPVELAYHFHGTHSHLINVPLPRLAGTSPSYKRKVGKKTVGVNRFDQAMAGIGKQAKSGKRNVILVYPLSAGQRAKIGSIAHRNGYDAEWMKPRHGEGMQQLHSQVMGVLSSKHGITSKKPDVTLSGHSAGGIALTNIMRSGFRPEGKLKVKFLDASYGYWAPLAVNRAATDTQFEIYAIPDSKTSSQGTRTLGGKPNVKFISVRGKKHGDFNSSFI